MLDVFDEQTEVLIKDGLANLYWFKADLKKCWLRSGVPLDYANTIYSLRDADGNALTKRKLMDELYEKLRRSDYDTRLKISRNFVRVLVEQESFSPRDRNHRVEIAERSALKLRELIARQEKQYEENQFHKRYPAQDSTPTYASEMRLVREQFEQALQLDGQARGYELERVFTRLMQVSKIQVQEPFNITGEQIDGAIKYDGNYYLIELKWIKRKCNQSDISSLYMKAEGKFDARGIFIAMEGYSSEVLSSLPKGKQLKVILLDGVHIASVIFGPRTFQELLNHALSYASLRGEIYCPHEIN